MHSMFARQDNKSLSEGAEEDSLDACERHDVLHHHLIDHHHEGTSLLEAEEEEERVGPLIRPDQ